jgi:hypothetical protein
MGILGQPRPAMRKGERRIVEQRLARHANIMRQLEAEGMSRENASRKAFEIVRRKIRTVEIKSRLTREYKT